MSDKARDEIERLVNAYGIARSRIGEYDPAAYHALMAAIDRLLAGSEDARRLDKPARIGHTTFGVGVNWATVIGRAQREYEYAKRPGKPMTD